MTIYLTGSMAYDRIMNFPGVFSDSILPDKIHDLNVCFLINSLNEKLGGCAGNIAHTLALLGEKGLVVSSVGQDFTRYESVFAAKGLSLEGISRRDEEWTAGAYIITDQSNNQITAFNPGAMRHAAPYTFPRLNAADIMIVSPTNMDDMVNHPRLCREKGVRCIFDPGQQIPALSPDQLLSALHNSFMLICNDYELELIMKATGKTQAEILALAGSLITTLGEKGSRVQADGREYHIAAVAPSRVADPTGAGDAYRGGLLKGLVLGLPLDAAARLGATAATYCVEEYGTQEHSYTLEEFKARHKAAFGADF